MKRPGNRAQRVKNKAAKESSKQWLNRHINDPYVHKANAEGYRSRAAFKLLEMDARLKLIKPGMRVVDLGAAPGGWSQVLSRKKVAHIAAIDILPMDPLEGVDFIEMDFTDDAAPDRLKALMKGEADLVLSDLSPNTTGHKRTDHLRMMALVEMAWEFASDVLAPGGGFVTKVFQGGAEGEFLAMLKPRFETVRHLKPPASRAESSEVYLVGTGFRK
ncbi:MAG: RlmE family RNA methyltransferase [Rhodospirillales bacterium]|nr:RlmE family RNA methyltransferase [Alphaproteobacteria bacterium]MCB9986363.1 RlmE family RNA methyltransferase [Rhodospirillales bacterium]USO07088.1 MAG: RlmE family RNA methyltransferase [Rhodospirillales bacterium]